MKIKKYFWRILVSIFAATGIISFFSADNFSQSSLNLKKLESGSNKLFKNALDISSANADTGCDVDSGGGGGCGGSASSSVGDAPACNCNSGGGDGGSSGGGGGSADASCFTYKQKVLTPSGTVEIGKLKMGDEVISYDEKSGELITSIIEKIAVHDGVESPWNNFKESPLIKLTVEVGNEMISTEVTQNHRYYDPENDLYKAIAEFNVGEKLKAQVGEGIIREKQIIIDNNDYPDNKRVIVYNLHLKNSPHNYLVNGLVVHNWK